MIDTHCHIDLYENPFEIIRECEQESIITIGVTNLPSHFAMGYPHVINCKKVRLALGFHPLYAERFTKEFHLFVKYLSMTSYVGEIGLDFSREGKKTKDIQLFYFKKILEELKGKNKILSIHSRKAEKEVLKLLLDNNIKNAIFHWYTGPINLISEIADKGYFFSINPAMIRTKSGQEIISKIPLTNLLTESDGPFIQHQNVQVRPRDVKIAIDYLSKMNGKINMEIENQILMNFKRIISNLK
jgi:TatD DNase family protein